MHNLHFIQKGACFFVKINRDLAQYIIDYNKKIVSYQINIMNPDAVIIASTNPARIGEHHFGAQHVAESGEAYIIDDVAANKDRNVVPGITLPIRFRDELIGMLGIGAGKNSALVGKILLSSTELLVEQTYLQSEINAEKQIRNEFLTLILRDSWENNALYFQHQLKLNHMDIQQGYFVCSASVQESLLKEPQKNSRTETAVLKYERVISNIISEFQMMVFPSKPITIFQAGILALLLPCTREQYDQEYSVSANNYITNVTAALNHLFGGAYLLGIGGFAADMTEIHTCYQRSVYAANISSKLNPRKKLLSFDDVYLEYELLSLPKTEQEAFCRETLRQLCAPDNAVWLNTLDAFLSNECNMTSTAEKLFIHRNTLLFRLHKVRALSGLDPLRFSEAARLHAALSLWKCNAAFDNHDKGSE